MPFLDMKIILQEELIISLQAFFIIMQGIMAQEPQYDLIFPQEHFMAIEGNTNRLCF